ncbi:MAG: DUF1460 domain-containing protein [Bacteroidales bacterium]|nr:DUF1460 domain-containing protein [Bacteroidales bacterium]
MKILLILISSLGLSCNLITRDLYTQRDVQLFNTVMNEAKKAHLSDSSISSIVVHTGKQLLNTPYVAGVLDKPETESLVVDLSRLDCVTFLESVVALSMTIKKGKSEFKDFCSELKYIRYRDGVMNGYASRLHYFSEWIQNNAQKGILEPVTTEIGGKSFVKKINLMTTKRANYPHLKEDSSMVAIKRAEERLSSMQHYYLPKEELLSAGDKIRNGDLIALVTSVDGLDVSHVGIAIYVNSELHLMHASTLSKKVEISEVSLFEMLRNRSTCPGIMVARLKMPLTM